MSVVIPQDSVRPATRWLPLALALVVAVTYAALVYFGLEQFKRAVPDALTLRLFGFEKTVRQVPERIANIASVLLILIPSAFMIEAALTGWKRSSLHRILFARTPSIRLDLACLLATEGQITGVIRLVLTFGLAAALGRWINETFNDVLGFTNAIKGLPIVLQVPIYYFVNTFFDYWDHRIEHRRVFWPFHRFHHSATEFCMITTMRQHPAAFVPLFVINFPMAVLGASVSVMIYVNVMVHLVGLFQHSNIDSDFGWVGRWLIQSPNHHRQHHTLDITTAPVAHFSMVPLWDRLFGTWGGESGQSLVIGVDKAYRQGWLFFIDLLRDYTDFWRGLFGAKVDPYDFGSAAKPPA